ncbi:MAG: response regulator [Sphingomonas taxi]
MILCPMPRTVLIVDDDPHIRQLLAFALDKAGLTTLEAADGEAGLAMAEAQAPDLVILDINMPRMDGLEVCRRLRAAGETPILFLSSRDDEIDRVLGIELGADDYVVKPFSPARGGGTGDGDPAPHRRAPARGGGRPRPVPRPAAARPRRLAGAVGRG